MLRSTKRIAALLILSLAVSAYGPCNKQNSIEQAAEAAKDIGGSTRDVIKAVGEAYDKKLITLAQKDRLADLLIKIAEGGQKGVQAIELIAKSGTTALQGLDAERIMRIFDDDVVAPFLEMLTELGKLSETSSATIRAALFSLRTTIVLLSSRIGRMDVIRQIEAREVWNA